MTFNLILNMEPWKRYVIFAAFWFWICLFLVGQNLESKTVLRIPRPYQLIGNNTYEKIVDVENDLDNLIRQKYEEIKKSKTVLRTPKPNQVIRTVNTSEKIVNFENGQENIIRQKYEETPKPYQLTGTYSNISEIVFEKENYQKNVTSVDNDEIKQLLLHSWITSKGYEHTQHWGTNGTESTEGKNFQKENQNSAAISKIPVGKTHTKGL